MPDDRNFNPGHCVDEYLAGNYNNIETVTLKSVGESTMIIFEEDELVRPIDPKLRNANPYKCEGFSCVLFDSGATREFKHRASGLVVKYLTKIEPISGSNDLRLVWSSKETILGFGGRWFTQSCQLIRI